MKPQRKKKLESFIAREVSNIIQRDMRDPRVKFVSVSKVEVSTELENAKIYISVFDPNVDKNKVIEILNKAAGFFKYRIGKVLKTRRIPNIIFKLDTSIEEGDKVLSKIFDMFPNTSTDSESEENPSE